MKQKIVFLLIFGLMSTFLTACTGKEPSAQPSADSAVTTVQETQAIPSETAAPVTTSTEIQTTAAPESTSVPAQTTVQTSSETAVTASAAQTSAEPETSTATVQTEVLTETDSEDPAPETDAIPETADENPDAPQGETIGDISIDEDGNIVLPELPF